MLIFLVGDCKQLVFLFFLELKIKVNHNKAESKKEIFVQN